MNTPATIRSSTAPQSLWSVEYAGIYGSIGRPSPASELLNSIMPNNKVGEVRVASTADG